MKSINRFSIIFCVLVIFLTIICTSSIPGYIINITKIEFFLCFVGVFIWLGNKNYSSNNFVSLILGICLISVLQLIIYPDNILHWFRFCLLMIVMVQFSIFAINHKINIIKIYYFVFLFMCIISTSMYIVVEVFKMQVPSFVFSNDWMMEQKCYYYVYNSRLDLLPENLFGFEIIRNSGFFSEPGLYSSFIIFSLFIYIFIKKEKKIFELVILLLSLFTTFSTTGFILLLIMGAYYINSRNKSTLLAKMALLILTLVVGAIAINNLLSAKQEEHAFSYAARTYDLIGGLQLFIQSPIWGWGYKNAEAFQAFSIQGFGDERVASNGVVTALYQLGLLGCAIFYVPLILIKKHFKTNKKLYILFLIILVISIMGEPIQYLAGGLAIFGYIYAYLISKKEVSIYF